MKNNVKEVLAQVLAVSVKNVLLFAFGMTLGFPTVLIPSLSDDGPPSDETLRVDKETLSWIGSVNMICVPLGCLVSGKIAHRFGRRRAMQIVNVPFFAAWMIFYFSEEIWHVFLALCLTGLTGGLLEAPVITYIAEISEPRLRGILSSTSTMSVTCGVMAEFLLGTFLGWRDIALVNAFVPLFSIVSLHFIPESPVWLITKGRTDEARRSVAWLKGWREVDETAEEFRVFQGQHVQAGVVEVEASGKGKSSPWLSRRFAWPFALVALSFFLCHFNGNTAFMVYAIKVLPALNASADSYVVTAVAGVVQLLGCVLSVAIINVFGKRKVNIVSMAATAACFAIVAAYASTNGHLRLDSCADGCADGDGWVPTTFLVLSSFFSFAGVKILPWVLVGEVFSNEVRATAAGLSSAVGYVLGFAASKIFLDMVATMTLPGVFWFDAAICVAGAALLYVALPETEGKTLVAIADHFAGGRKIGNGVGRAKDAETVV